MRKIQKTQTLNRPTLSGLTRKTSNIQTRHKRPALHGLVIVGVLVAVAVAMTFALTGNIQDNLDSMTGSNRIAITTINAYTAGDRLVVTGNIQNLGSQPLMSVTIDEITAGSLVITQDLVISDGSIGDNHGSLSLAGTGGDAGGTAITSSKVDVDTDVTATGTHTASKVNHGAAITADDGTKFVFGGAAGGANAMVDITGLSTDEGKLESLGAGDSRSFRIVITGQSVGSSDAAVLDILRTVPASTQLFMTVAATDGSASTISDPRTVRVTAR